MREHHKAKDGGFHDSHGIPVTTSKKEVVIKLSVDHFNVYKGILFYQLGWYVGKKSLRLGHTPIISMQGS